MKITFKDVGQGDSILLEWVDVAGVRKVGIIDCKLKGKANPVIRHIDQNKYEQIEFIILSHPHEDHYSGLLQLLEYVERTGKRISRMCHTVGFNGVVRCSLKKGQVVKIKK
ncbi:MAG TPA: hypothetical protein VGQ53_16305 [Chitinophagaceae bacterium]|jgi:beta-lactamase superfamily II metal-dependent hydrolase|nr:hypothetical protein [Chitinophagaceae bacterium]